MRGLRQHTVRYVALRMRTLARSNWPLAATSARVSVGTHMYIRSYLLFVDLYIYISIYIVYIPLFVFLCNSSLI